MKIFALESSCDESSLAFLDGDGRTFPFERTISQAALHGVHGGVVPELATAAHLEAFPKLWHALRTEWPSTTPDLVAVTVGPGLAGGLAIGLAAARTAGLAFGCPVVGVNHLHGHAFSPFLPPWQAGGSTTTVENWLPHLGLLVSGGNTLLFRIEKKDLSLTRLAGTVDDAAGEALDKGARLLGIPYPGGAGLERLAREGNPHAYPFPVAFGARRDVQFSFSGLKTSLRRRLDSMAAAEVARERANLCASYQWAVISALLARVRHEVERFPHGSIGLSGGVSQNALLRDGMEAIAADHATPLLLVPARYCGDNASIIALAALLDPAHTISCPMDIYPKLPLGQLNAFS
ncbi:MAG: tRNA (adenosine(37)-N6)-threonylcarbamoyltransferase complex transferase subunit TsaD [Puniceicoccales bacterium]|jgi:N6-L-threonylcarbamoyladenine synthase|nr:tRNA (adenosine(37)-N6)-threonylcarbamoyltransferase complex transferase subunit TsaD [Puniceicoccales bacterium]